MGKKIIWIIAIILAVLFLVSAFLYYSLLNPNYPKPVFESSVYEITENTVIEPIHISYVLTEIGAYQLHNPVLSSDTPKINTKITDTWYFSEVKSGQVITKKATTTNPDIIIYTNSKEILESIKSGDVKSYIKSSVSSGETSLELKAGYHTLFSKRYLPIYTELTGKTLTGGVIKIFAN